MLETSARRRRSMLPGKVTSKVDGGSSVQTTLFQSPGFTFTGAPWTLGDVMCGLGGGEEGSSSRLQSLSHPDPHHREMRERDFIEENSIYTSREPCEALYVLIEKIIHNVPAFDMKRYCRKASTSLFHFRLRSAVETKFAVRSASLFPLWIINIFIMSFPRNFMDVSIPRNNLKKPGWKISLILLNQLRFIDTKEKCEGLIYNY